MEGLPRWHVAFLCMMDSCHFYTVCSLFSSRASKMPFGGGLSLSSMAYREAMPAFSPQTSTGRPPGIDAWASTAQDDVNSAGFVAGWLQSANVCGRVVTSSLWGLAAQRHGARPVLRITLAALFVGGVLFGCCTNFALAMCHWVWKRGFLRRRWRFASFVVA